MEASEFAAIFKKYIFFGDFHFFIFHENFKLLKINEIFIVGHRGRTEWKVTSKTPDFWNKILTTISKSIKNNIHQLGRRNGRQAQKIYVVGYTP